MGRSAQPTQTHVNPTPPALQPMQNMLAAAMQARMMGPGQAAPAALPAGMDIFQQLYGQSMPNGRPAGPTGPSGPAANSPVAGGIPGALDRFRNMPRGRPQGGPMQPPGGPMFQMDPAIMSMMAGGEQPLSDLPIGAEMLGPESMMNSGAPTFKLPQMGGRPTGPFTPPDLMRPMVSGSRIMSSFGQPYAPRGIPGVAKRMRR